MNPPELTILTADTDAACDPETGTCTISQTPIPSPGVAPVNRRSPSGPGGNPKALAPQNVRGSDFAAQMGCDGKRAVR